MITNTKLFFEPTETLFPLCSLHLQQPSTLSPTIPPPKRLMRASRNTSQCSPGEPLTVSCKLTIAGHQPTDQTEQLKAALNFCFPLPDCVSWDQTLGSKQKFQQSYRSLNFFFFETILSNQLRFTTACIVLPLGKLLLCQSNSIRK